MKIIGLLPILLFFQYTLLGQSTYEHISNRGIYGFLDEMANEQLIHINTTVKPYSRSFILEKLLELRNKKDTLNNRQQNELFFYLNDYSIAGRSDSLSMPDRFFPDIFSQNKHAATSINPLGFFYKDKDFIFGLQPIWGVEYIKNNNGEFHQTYGGGRIYGRTGEHLSFYASLRDYHSSDILVRPAYLTRKEGGVYKSNSLGGGDYSEMRGGIIYHWKWGNIGVVKDHLVWGDQANGSIILSGRTPSFAMVKLHLSPADWFDFNYFHGWLVSEVLDSLRSYSTNSGYNRKVFREKYMAANMFTIMPIRGVRFSFGNSIVYGDIPIQPAYFIPFMFFKSIDHTINAHIENQNSQMFANISIRNIKHVHLYASVFIDEFSIERISDPGRHNFHSYKAGTNISNWPVQNISFTAEYTQSSPITYKHRIPVLTYETNHYNLGYFMKDNARNYFAALSYKPLAGLTLRVSYEHAIKGNEYQYIRTTPFVDTYPLIGEKTWEKKEITFFADYQFLSNTYVFVEYILRDTKGFDADNKNGEYYLDLYGPELFHGNTSTIHTGLNIGF